jgi:ABC-type multidrug transport system fused ATPase/permease subunit
MTVGDVVLLLQSLIVLQPSLGRLVQMSSLLSGHLLYFRELFAFLGAVDESLQGSDNIEPLPSPIGAIQFENVDYSYVSSGRNVLANLSFRIGPGECVALVGENGAGKSTVAKLMCRLYDPRAGTIRYNGVDLRDVDVAGLRAKIAAVFQDFGRYKLTVAENVALGRLEAIDDAELIQSAIAQSGFSTHAKALVEGIHTQLGTDFGGQEMSSGQWQALAIARAVIRDAEVVILDEPTAALDPRAESELFERFADLTKGKTTLLITHRLASVRRADRILVLKRGRIIEEGRHDDLVRRGGEYSQLYALQAKAYNDDAM